MRRSKTRDKILDAREEQLLVDLAKAYDKFARPAKLTKPLEKARKGISWLTPDVVKKATTRAV
jgi:hypothetical protein